MNSQALRTSMMVAEELSVVSASPQEEDCPLQSQDESVFTFEKIVNVIGHFGRYQQILIYLLCLLAIPNGWHSLCQVFVSATPDFHCSVRSEEIQFAIQGVNISEEQLWNATLPREVGAQGMVSWSQCQKYDLEQVNLSLGLVDWSWYVNQRNNGSHQVVSCQFWWYDKSRFLSTTVTEWDIVCDRHWLRQLDTTFYMAGAIIGSSGMGWLADIFGRKNILLCNLFLMILCSLLAAFSPAFWFFLIMRFLIGIFCPGVYSIAYILGMEFVGASKRHLIGLIIGICFIVGHITLTGMAYVVREWRKLQLFIAVPPLGCLIYCWFIPESPRWLILKNRTVEAEKIIRKLSHINKVGLPKTIILITDSKNKSKTVILRKHTLLDLLKTPNLRRNTLTVFISWFSISCGYYGLALNTHNLSGEPYLNFLLTGLVEIPAAAFFFVIVDRLGRKRIILGTEVLAGVTCVAVAFIPDAFGWINVTLCLVGRFFISMAFGVMYLYSAEIFPTALRTTGIGCAQMFGRLGAIACQWVILLADFWRPSPFVTFGIMSFAAGVTSLFLPETLGRTLPETLEDGEKMV